MCIQPPSLPCPPCLPWRDFPGKYCNFYIIYKSWQYSLSIACQVWARGTNLPAIRQAGTQRGDKYKLNKGAFSLMSLRLINFNPDLSGLKNL